MYLNILRLPGFEPKLWTSTAVAASTGDAEAATSNADALQRQSTAREMIEHSD
jgi:hypothetical protein